MKPQHSTLLRVRGFSLVELLVGIVVAMAAVLVVTQVFRVSEGQRRTTSGGDDAQTTGAIALSLLQRELRQAGQGLMSPRLLMCQLDLGGGRNIRSLAPVIINPPTDVVAEGDDNTDTIVISYGDGWGSPEGGLIGTQPGPATYVVPGSLSYRPGQRVVATPQTRAAPCNLTLTSVAGDPTPSSVTVALGVAGSSNGVLYNLGRAPRFLAYAVRNNRLTVCDFTAQNCASVAAANWNEVADSVVGLRAEYARDTTVPRDGFVDAYDTTTPTGIVPAGCGWERVVGVRLAIVARSRQPDTADVTASAPSWSGGASAPLTPPGADWQRYRYKTFETTVPLRNAPAASEPVFSPCP
ncbi:PilW family protein [Roseateles asaccharophilus]|uniref:Type IV pilus assembly protein PilW n=1 Tax=Roseateles asaccharophilus TaxID=582607 RepID=A0ABU2A1K2_9BURK|nr:PilW family protein [Roseateles asaccharophilus]MDR7331072.1 type IV pilus assembly protein PilW [Roseateles asaccharophilus]